MKTEFVLDELQSRETSELATARADKKYVF